MTATLYIVKTFYFFTSMSLANILSHAAAIATAKYTILVPCHVVKPLEDWNPQISFPNP